MRIIVGLGNVGRRYAATRHNAGFRVVDEVAARHQVRISQPCRHFGGTVALYGDWAREGSTVRLVQPQTMMNGSGQALRALKEWGVATQDLLIVCDDVNLPLGTLRLRPQGGAGGHHGLASCLEVLGTDQVPRLRIGVGSASMPKDLVDFVLLPFDRTEQPVVAQVVARAADAADLWVEQGIHAAMNRMNAGSGTGPA